MRTYKEVHDELDALTTRNEKLEALRKELDEIHQAELQFCQEEDVKAGRTNVCSKKHSDVFMYDKAVWQYNPIRAGYEEFPEYPRVLQCSYCGSLHPEETIKFLKMPGTLFSGCDQKYGWPHKFAIDPVNPGFDREIQVGSQSEKDENGNWIHTPLMGKLSHLHFKFYNEHLEDATDEMFNEFSLLSAEIFGISWGKDQRGIYYKAPKTEGFYGYQRAGEIGANGTIRRLI